MEIDTLTRCRYLCASGCGYNGQTTLKCQHQKNAQTYLVCRQAVQHPAFPRSAILACIRSIFCSFWSSRLPFRRTYWPIIGSHSYRRCGQQLVWLSLTFDVRYVSDVELRSKFLFSRGHSICVQTQIAQPPFYSQSHLATHLIIIMTALPSLDTCGLHGTGLSLWHTLLQAENTALKDPSRTKAKYNDPLIVIRLLGFFLKDFWDRAHDGYLGSNPYARMVTEITSCLNKPGDKATYDALVELGLRYRNCLLRVCELRNYLLWFSKCNKQLPVRSNTGGRPTPLRHVSRPSFDVVKGRILEELGNTPETKPNVRKQVCFLGIYVGHQLIFFRRCYAMDTDVPSAGSMICSLASILMRLTQPPRP